MDISNTLQLLCASMMQQQSHNSHSNSNCCCPHHPRGPSARAAGAGHAVARDNKQHRSYAPPNDLQTWRMSVPDQSHIHANIHSQSSHKPRTRLMDQFPHKLQSTSSTNNTDNLECDNECADGYESVGGSSMLSVEPYHPQHLHRNKKLKNRTSQNLKRNKNNKKNRNRNRKKNRKNKNGRNRMYKRNKGKGKKIILRGSSRSRSRNRVLSDLSGGESSDSSDVNEWCDNNNNNRNDRMYNYKRNKDRDLSDEDEWYNNNDNYNNDNYNNNNNNNNNNNPWQLKRKNKKKKRSKFIASDESGTDIDIDDDDAKEIVQSEKETPQNVITFSESDDVDIQLQDPTLNGKKIINNLSNNIDNVFKQKDLKTKLLKLAKKKAKKEGYRSVSKLIETRIKKAKVDLGEVEFGKIVARLGGSCDIFECFCADIYKAYIKLLDGRGRKSVPHKDIHYTKQSKDKFECLVKGEDGKMCGIVKPTRTLITGHWKRTHELEWCYICDMGHIIDD